MKYIPGCKEVREAIRRGDDAAALDLVRSDRSLLTAMTPFGTWLHVAASFGRASLVQELVALGVDMNTRGGTFNANALKVACFDGHVDVVRLLLGMGIEMDVSEPERNPLFGAISGGHVEVARILVDASIDTRVSYSGETVKDMDAYTFAVQYGQTEIAALLSGHAPNNSSKPTPLRGAA